MSKKEEKETKKDNNLLGQAELSEKTSKEYKIIFSALNHANKKGCFSIEEATFIFNTLQKFK